VSTCVAEEAACAAGDDACAADDLALLQGKVAVDDHADKHDAKIDAKSMEKESDGWPDFKKAFDTIKSAMGGVDKLEKDFDGVKTAAKTFNDEVHTHVETLVAETSAPSMGIDDVRGKVEKFYRKIHDAAHKLFEALKKVTMAWVNGIGKMVPQQLKAPMNMLLAKVSDQGKLFTDSFHGAAESLKNINSTATCGKVKHSLHTVLKKASDLAKSATGLSSHGLSKDIKAARDALPEALKKEIEKMLKKANNAADRILSKLAPAMKEITHGVAKAFDDHCTGLPHSGAGRLQVGAFLALVLSMLSFSV